jgi:cytidine deaminase
MEFSGLPMYTTIHAEQASLANAVAHGEDGIKAIAVTAQPCGMCRQFLNELNTASELKIQVGSSEPLLLSALLPNNFGPEDLDIQNHLLDPQSNRLSLENPSDDELVNAALEAANQSYAPYSSGFAGTAIQTRNGQIFKGHYLENAAFNPSLLPLQACLSNLVIAGRVFAEIADVVLVQHKTGSVNHVLAAQTLLQSVTSVPIKVVNAV